MDRCGGILSRWSAYSWHRRSCSLVCHILRRRCRAPGACVAPGGYDLVESGTGIVYRCTCLRSVSTGRDYCHWKVLELNGKAKSGLQIGAEWGGLHGQLNYAEVARTDSGSYRSYGDVSYFYTGTLTNAPTGRLANVTVVYRWTGSSWLNCRDSGFYYSGGAWAWFGLTWSFGTPPCGDGFYFTNNYGFVYDGAQWRGNPSGVASGHMTWMGCLSCRSAAAPPAPKAPPPAVVKMPPQPSGVVGAPTTSAEPDLFVRGGPSSKGRPVSA